MKRVVVIRTGPSGAAATLNLPRCWSIEVLLLDRGVFPRRKVCASGRSPWELDLLDHLGVGVAVRKEAQPVRAGIIGSSRGPNVVLADQYQAAVLLRARLDSLLAHTAARSGAELREGVRVRGLAPAGGRLVGVQTDQGDITADTAILCNGANTPLAREPRPGQKYIFGCQYLIVDALLDIFEEVTGQARATRSIARGDTA